MNRQDKFSQNAANKIRLVQIIIMCCIMLSGTLQPSSAADITTTCPSSYVEGVDSQVNCTVNLTAFDVCINGPTFLTFDFTPSGSSSKQFWCSTSIKSCGSTLLNEDVCNNCSCGCLDNTTSTTAEYQLIFTPDRQTHAGGTLLCNIVCLSQSPLSSNDNCAPIREIEIPSTTQPPTDDGCLPGCAIGPCVAVVAIAIIAIIIGIMVKKKLDKRKCNNKSASPENPQQGQGGQNQNGSNAKPPPPATGVPSETEGGDTNKYTGTGNSPKRPHTTEEKVELSTVGQPSTGSPSDEASKPSRPLPTPRKPEPLPSGTVPMPSVETNSRANPLPPIEKKPVMAV